jgi:hypothetical protein
MDTFDFVAYVTKSRRNNTAYYLTTMHPLTYFSRPSNMAFHDLSTVLKPPKNLRYVLGLSLKFIPSPRTNVPWTAFEDHTFARFDRELKVKVFMTDHEDNGTYNPDLYVKSRWTPPPWKIPLEITGRLHSFKEAVNNLLRQSRVLATCSFIKRRLLTIYETSKNF